jgi:hypothetical protein
MPDFGFVGPTYQAQSIYQNDQACINWYPEVDQTKSQQERGYVALYPTPGLTTLATLPAGLEVRMVYPFGNYLYAVSGSTVYEIDASYTATVIGTMLTSTGQVKCTDNGVSIYFADGIQRYSFTHGDAAITNRSDGGFTGATWVDQQDGFIFYNQPNTQGWGCTDVDVLTSGALNISAKDQYGDPLSALISDHGDVFLLGTKTTEVWTDAGLQPFPFQRRLGATLMHGIAAPYSLSRIGEAFAFVTQDQRGRNIVAMMSSNQVQRISTYAIENGLAQGTVIDAIAYTYQWKGHEFYVLSLPTQDVTWVYDLSSQMWHQWLSRDDRNVLHRHRSNCHAMFNGTHVVGDYQNGKLYKLDDTIYTEDGKPIPCIRRARHLTEDLKRIFHRELQIQFQPGVGLQSGQGSNPQAMLRWSDDGGSTWSNEHWTSIGRVGSYKNRARWTKLGQARDRVYEVTVTDPVYRAVISANLVAESGAH